MPDDARWIRIQLWKPVRQVFQAAGELFDEAERLRGVSEAEPVTPVPVPARGKLAPPPPGAPAAYLRRRRALCDLIEGQLDPVLTDSLGTWQTHLCTTAIVSFIDERERVALGALADAWALPLVQGELLGIDDGGDRMFAQLHELLARADVHDLVFEVHLLCLRAGFVGRHAGRRHEIDRISGAILERLRPRPRGTAVIAAPPAPARRRVGFLPFPVRYYVGVAVLAIAAFLGLRIVSGREVARSSLADYCHYHDGAGS